MATSTLGSGTLVLAGTTSGTTTVTATAVAGTTTLTLPAATDTLVGKATTDTLTNKTLTGAAMNGTVGATTPSTGAFTTVQIGTNPAGVSIGVLGIPNQKRIYGRNAANSADVNILYVDGSNGLVLGPSDAAVIDSSGNLLVGATSTTGRLTVADSTTSVLTLRATSAVDADGRVIGTLNFQEPEGTGDGTLAIEAAISGLRSGTDSFNSGGRLAFYTRPFNGTLTQAMTLDASGNLLVGTTTTPSSTQSGFYVNAFGMLMGVPSGNVNAAWYKPSGASGVDYHRFIVGGNQYGAISWNGATGTLYTTTSDYRLKENVQPMQNALEVVSRLKPVTYNWKESGTTGQGFIAHELQEVMPDAVSGKKDGVETYKDEDDSEQTRPQYQGIDTSFLVATLTAAIQELNAKFEEYKAAHP